MKLRGALLIKYALLPIIVYVKTNQWWYFFPSDPWLRRYFIYNFIEAPYSCSVILIFLTKICVLRRYNTKSRLVELSFCVGANLLNDLGSVYFLVGNQSYNFSLPLCLPSSLHLWNILNFMELSLSFSFVRLKILK